MRRAYLSDAIQVGDQAFYNEMLDEVGKFAGLKTLVLSRSSFD
jgi:hypothetical protein